MARAFRFILLLLSLLLSSKQGCSAASQNPEQASHARSLASTTPVQVAGYSGVKAKYSQVLGLSQLFYEAQRSGKLPAKNRIPWRGDAHLQDLVPGGWYDAGDNLKISFPMATTVSFLAWGLLQFPQAYRKAGEYKNAVENLRWGADYLMRCHVSKRRFVGMIGSVGDDHSFWGRPEDWQGPRPAYIWNHTSPVADLAGAASAALSSSSLVFKAGGQGVYARRMLSHAKQLYAWARSSQGFYHTAFPGELVYESSRYHDKLMYAAAWLAKATGRRPYLKHALRHWREAPDHPYENIYVGYDSVYAPAVNLLLSLANEGVGVPGRRGYSQWFQSQFLDSWWEADGDWGITKTPKGLAIVGDGGWGSLGGSTRVAFQMLLHAQYVGKRSVRTACVAWAKAQVDYALGISGGRSYVVGWGTNPPTHPHHGAASCPSPPDTCTWDDYHTPLPNPHTLYGALVGGPSWNDEYNDVRDDYQRNEVAVDYNSGFTGALAGLLQLWKP